MNGWKTKVGGGLAIAAGILGYAVTLFGYPGMSGETAIALIVGGMTALGLGHKADKIRAALEALAKAKAGKALVLGFIALPILGGCATMQGDGGADPSSALRKLHEFTQADIQAALDMATAANDQAAMQCYPYLLEQLDKPLPAGPQVKGAVSAFQATRGILEHSPGDVQSFAEDFNLHCAALFNSAAVTLVKFGVLGAGKTITGGLAP